MAKYLIHGLLLTTFFLVHPLGWLYPILLVALMGGTLALPVLVVFLLLFVGVVNNTLTSILWFPVRFSVWKILIQGIALLMISLVLFIVFLSLDTWIQSFMPQIFVWANSWFFRGILRIGFVALIGTPIFGWVGKNIVVLLQSKRKKQESI